MKRLAVALALLAAGPTVLAAAPAAADEPSTTHAAFIFGPGQNVGELGDRYLYGILAGTEAGFQIRPSVGAPYDFGTAWSFLWGTFRSSSDANLDEWLTVIQLEGVGRARLRLPGPVPSFIRAEVGLDLYRASIPIPPDGEQVYLGPTAGLGFEVDVRGLVISLGARYGLFTGGPTGLRLIIGIGKGSR